MARSHAVTRPGCLSCWRSRAGEVGLGQRVRALPGGIAPGDIPLDAGSQIGRAELNSATVAGYSTPMHARTFTYVAIAAAAALTACRGNFRVSRFPSNESLYSAGVREFERKHWGNAILAFEKLTTDLPARDTLLPRSFWYLAHAHTGQDEHLLAAQSFSRLFESFPDDTLADDAALEAGRSYRRMWRKPELDATYGETALTAFNALLGLYPDSEHAEQAKREIAELEQWFATK